MFVVVIDVNGWKKYYGPYDSYKEADKARKVYKDYFVKQYPHLQENIQSSFHEMTK